MGSLQGTMVSLRDDFSGEPLWRHGEPLWRHGEPLLRQNDTTILIAAGLQKDNHTCTGVKDDDG